MSFTLVMSKKAVQKKLSKPAQMIQEDVVRQLSSVSCAFLPTPHFSSHSFLFSAPTLLFFSHTLLLFFCLPVSHRCVSIIWIVPHPLLHSPSSPSQQSLLCGRGKEQFSLLAAAQPTVEFNCISKRICWVSEKRVYCQVAFHLWGFFLVREEFIGA